jgi:hypothetical protein
VIDQSLAQPGQESTTRTQRGRDLYRQHADEITFEQGVWYVPSQHDSTSVYEVRLGRRESCECIDYGLHGHEDHFACKHIICATIARAKTRQCAGCSKRFPRREVVEVLDWHESLVFHEGDTVCAACALAHGVL